MNSEKIHIGPYFVYYLQDWLFVSELGTIFVHNMYWTRNSMNTLLSYFELIDARMSASDKDLPVCIKNNKLGYRFRNFFIFKIKSYKPKIFVLAKLLDTKSSLQVRKCSQLLTHNKCPAYFFLTWLVFSMLNEV